MLVHKTGHHTHTQTFLVYQTGKLFILHLYIFVTTLQYSNKYFVTFITLCLSFQHCSGPPSLTPEHIALGCNLIIAHRTSKQHYTSKQHLPRHHPHASFTKSGYSLIMLPARFRRDHIKGLKSRRSSSTPAAPQQKRNFSRGPVFFQCGDHLLQR